MKNVVILGAGTGGSIVAAKLARQLPQGWHVTLVDRDDAHVYQPGLLFVPFGKAEPQSLVRARRPLAPPGVTLRIEPVERVEPLHHRIVFGDGQVLGYDVLVLATGSRILPENVTGLTGEGWLRSAFDFYTMEGATALAERLDRLESGRLLVHVAEMPIKCPVAPLEFAFLADAFLQERGRRDAVEIVYATPLDGAFTKPRASAVLGGMMDARRIKVETDFVVDQVDGERRVMRAFDGRELDYDVLVTVPPHGGAELVTASEMGDESGWFPVNKHSLQSREWPAVFALGDCTDAPTSKAGAVAHYQGEVLVANVLAFIADKPLVELSDGHATCFVETGHGKAMLIDFNYDTEPLPGVFPYAGVGPFTLLGESTTNHWGKIAFEWLYWNVLLKGTEIPLHHRMSMAGKEHAAPSAERKVANPVPRGPSRLERIRAAKAGKVAEAPPVSAALSPAQQAVVDAARGEFQSRGVSPNIRRLTIVAGLSTRELYTLFPRAPAKTVAQLAGIPKPVGCI